MAAAPERPDLLTGDSPTIVLTGAAGWLGQALVHRLHRDTTRRLLAIARDASEASQLGSRFPTVDIRIADLTEPETPHRLLDAINGPVQLIHTAGLIHPRRVAEFWALNAEATRSLAEAAAARGVERMVHISSNSPIGTNPTPTDTFGEHEPYHPYLGYGHSKMAGELAVFEAASAGLDAVVIRPPWFYGPWQPPRQTSFFRLVRTGKFPMIGDGQQRRSMVYIDNLVDGVMLALDTPGISGRAYWIADAETPTVEQIVETVRQALTDAGYPCAERQLRLPRAAATAAELGDRLVQRLGLYQTQLHVLGEMGHTIAVDISAARRDLNYQPAVSLYEGMSTSIAWCREHQIEL